MTLSSISSSSTSAAYGNPAVFQTRATRRQDADADDAAPAQAATPTQRGDGPGRRNPLVAAMMSALQSLLPTRATATAAATSTAASTAAASTTAAAGTATATPAATTTASDPAASLREAAYAFAHELYSALRGGSSGEGQSEDGGENHPRHHHHHHRSEGSSGYGDLAQRLTALAQKLDGSSTTPAATATPASTAAAPAATPVATTPTPVTATPVSTPASPPTSATPPVAAATPATTGTTINITINVNLGSTAAAAPAVKAASSPLVEAFKHMFEALNPAGAAATTGPSPSERLSAFLRQMAQSLSNGSSDTQPSTPTSGSLLNVSA